MSLRPTLKMPRLYMAASEDGGVLLDPEHDRLVKLNPTATEMWALLRSGKTEDQVADHIAQRYSVDRVRVVEDLHQLLQSAEHLRLAPASVQDAEHTEFQSPSEWRSMFPWYGRNASAVRPAPSLFDIVRAFLGLALFDLILSSLSFESLCSCVRNWQLKKRHIVDQLAAIGAVCAAVESACVWYPKKTLCLQRSAVTTCLLRSRGVAARMVVGVRSMPFLAHAWVEVDGTVVNDYPRVNEFYRQLTSY